MNKKEDRPGETRTAFYNRTVSTPSNAVDVPRLALPKGGGALKGIDEKFSVNAANGTASLSLPLPLSPSRSTPALSLRYDSGSGNGPFGIGWSLDLASIGRRTDKQLPRYFDSLEDDVFVIVGGEDLVPALREDGAPWETTAGNLRIKRYRPRVEGEFALIERVWRDGDAAFYWKVTKGDNSVTFYGVSPDNRVSDPRDARKVFRWLPELAFDDKGNVARYEFKLEDGAPGPVGPHDRNRFDELSRPRFTNLYLKRVSYGNRQPWYASSDYEPVLPSGLTFTFDVVFDYGEHGALFSPGDPHVTVHEQEAVPWPARVDAYSDYRAGFEIRTLRLCRRILMFHRFDELGPAPYLVRSLDFEYATSQPDTTQFAEVTYLASAISRGYTRRTGDVYDVTSLPPQRFSYQALHWQTDVQHLSAADGANAPEGLGGAFHWVDLWNEGISGILCEQADALLYKSNLGNGQFTAATAVAERPSRAGLGGVALSVQDLDADGSRQLVVRTPELQGYFELDADDRWQAFTAFPQVLTIDTASPNVLHLDLDGDGRPDVLVTEEYVSRWYSSKGRDGYASPELVSWARDEERGPVLLWNDPLQRIFLADVTGDGLADIVRIRNGEVCYWPSLGYGRFGEKVAMHHAPVFASPEQYDPAYVHLADVTGTGASDLIYLDRGGATVWLNLAGNGWSGPQSIAVPEVMHPNRFDIVDLLGDGTPCLVWSSPLPANASAPLRYIDLLGGRKPHVLTGHTNGIGRETTLHYRSSTRFYLEDKRAGTPWKTKLPFPVQCVARVESRETVTNTLLIEEYSYHHGYYDHAEREFRGFGRVDQTDTESFARWVREDATNVVDEAFHQPVVLTRTWFHTGAQADNGDALALFEGDYWYRNPRLLAIPDVDMPGEPALPPAGMPTDLSPTELREAFRSCRGMALRREVFALDAPAQGASDAQRIAELTPYSVTLHNCQVRRLQSRGDNRHGVFQVHESEALTLAYERRPVDVRIAHTLQLEVDRYGRSLSSVAIVYGRQLPTRPPDVPEDVWTEQKAAHLVLSERVYTDDDMTAAPSPYRLPVECEAKNFELTGVALPPGQALFHLAEVRSAVASAVEIGFEVVPTDDGKIRKRLVEHTRVLHLGDDLVSARAFRKASPLGLVYGSYQLALTRPVLRSLFSTDRIPDAALESVFGVDCRYVHFDDAHGTSDGDWWIPSGSIDYLDAATAPLRFYQPAGFVDARGARTDVSYLGEDASRVNADAHWGLLASSTDAAGNEMRAESFDFRACAPVQLRDVNGNLSAIVLDDLGRVVASAVMGKGDEADDLTTFALRFADRSAQAQHTQQLLGTAGDDAAAWLLADATTRWVYDDTTLPVRAASIGREQHAQTLDGSGEPLKLQLAFEYTGGAGNVVLKKVRVPEGRWLGNGRSVLDNKGAVVKQFEPYFSSTHLFEIEQQLIDTGVSPLLTYDSAGRHVRTDHPDGTFDYTTFGAWSQQLFDQNDTVLESSWLAARAGLPPGDPQRKAADQTALHAGTPLTIHLDSMGRQICSTAHNRTADGNGTVTESFPTVRAELDIEGNVVLVTDARGNIVLRQRYDLLGRAMYQTSMDTGERWTLLDSGGSIARQWDSRDQRVRNVFDVLHRPVEEWLSIGGAPETLVLAKTWGEQAPDAELHNLRGQLWKSYDTVGLFETVRPAFKGNRIESRRRFAAAYDATVNWPSTGRDALLEPETFRTRAHYDALNRPTRLFSPDTPAMPASEIMLGYDEGGRLTQVRAALRGGATTSFVHGIRYNEKGQRLSISYGNGLRTDYSYEPLTFRLSRVRTTREAGPVLQDLQYTYDPVANIVSQRDAAQQTTYFAGAAALPGGSYEYDALYRLTRAFGREHIGQNAPTSEWDQERTGQILPGDGQAMQPYDERYEYDLVGNILQLVHDASSGSEFLNRWTRTYTYETASNRLTTTQTGQTITAYTHNPHGSMTTMPHLQEVQWDWAEHLHHIRQGTTDAYYGYDETGRRARKVVEKQGSIREVRLYFGAFEIFRRFRNGMLVLERETQHVMDDDRRIAIVETRTAGTDDSPAESIRYQLSNHLQSATLEVDQAGAVISYEEYHPFGTSSWQAGRTLAEVALKRYRYSGLERDDESGFGYHGARYYAPWLARWTAADPAMLVDGPNVYAYATNNPVVLHDPNGMQTGKPSDTDKVIMQMTDPELHKFLSGLEPNLQKVFAAGATGAFAQRAAKMIGRYNLQSVQITSKTRTIGDVAKYSHQGKANYLDLFGSKRRADEAEHLLSTAAAKHVLQATDQWKRDSVTIVLAEAHSRIKTPTDNQLAKDLKSGKIDADQWLRHSRANAYRSWIEARAQGVEVPTAAQFADAILQQERQLKIRYYQILQDRLQEAQERQAYIDFTVQRHMGNAQIRLDQTADAQAHGQVRTQFFVGLGIVNLQALGNVMIFSGAAVAAAPVAIGSVPAAGAPVAAGAPLVAGTPAATGATSTVVATTGFRIAAAEASTGVRIAVQSEEALLLAAEEEAIAAEAAELGIKVFLRPLP